jgi:hypothetical protein
MEDNMSFTPLTDGSIWRQSYGNENYGIIAAQSIQNMLNMRKIWEEANILVGATTQYMYGQEDNFFFDTGRNLSKISLGSTSLTYNGIGTIFHHGNSGTYYIAHGIDAIDSTTVNGSLWFASGVQGANGGTGSPWISTNGSKLFFAIGDHGAGAATHGSLWITNMGSGAFSGVGLSGTPTITHIKFALSGTLTTLGGNTPYYRVQLVGAGSLNGVALGSKTAGINVNTSVIDVLIFNGSDPPTADLYYSGTIVNSAVNISAANEQHLNLFIFNLGSPRGKGPPVCMEWMAMMVSGNTSGVPVYTSPVNTGSLMRYASAWTWSSGMQAAPSIDASFDGGSNYTSGAYKGLTEPTVSGTSMSLRINFQPSWPGSPLGIGSTMNNWPKSVGWGAIYY